MELRLPDYFVRGIQHGGYSRVEADGATRLAFDDGNTQYVLTESQPLNRDRYTIWLTADEYTHFRNWYHNVLRRVRIFHFTPFGLHGEAEGRFTRSISGVRPVDQEGFYWRLSCEIEWRELPIAPTTDFDFDMFLAGGFYVPPPNEIPTFYGRV